MSTTTTVFDLPLHDVFILRILNQLSLKDLFNLRCCSRRTRLAVDTALTDLKELNLSTNNSKYIDRAFEVLATNCINLQTLNLSNCHWLSNDLLMPLLLANPKLRVIDVHECCKVTPTALQAITGEQLEKLTINKCLWEVFDNWTEGCITIYEHCMVNCFSNLPHLKELSMKYTMYLTDEVLIAVAKNCPNLRILDVTGCHQITDIGME